MLVINHWFLVFAEVMVISPQNIDISWSFARNPEQVRSRACRQFYLMCSDVNCSDRLTIGHIMKERHQISGTLYTQYAECLVVNAIIIRFGSYTEFWSQNSPLTRGSCFGPFFLGENSSTYGCGTKIVPLVELSYILSWNGSRGGAVLASLFFSVYEAFFTNSDLSTYG